MSSTVVYEHNIYYETLGKADRPSLLLMHGWMEVGRDLAAVGNALAGAGYRVILPDLPGYGRSVPPQRTYPPDFYQRDAAIMAGLLDQLGLTSAHVMGFSDGGEVALLIGVTRPDLCRTVIAWGATGWYSPALGAWVRDQMPLQVITPSHRARHPGQPVERWQAEWKRAFGEIVAHGGDLSRSRAAALRAPLLLMVGDQDALNPVEEARQFGEQSGGQTTFQVFPQTGHAIHHERPDAFIAAVTTFLKQS
ncbi:MAG: alpha/beta hydrolase [Anaerolinea sp.]|nr:alpha/beta hydrolase [Anaerolinea sp.]